METWCLILDPPSPAGYNMAADEALVESCRRGSRGPTIRLYGWNRPAISLGYFQRPETVVDLDRCRDAGVPVVRRTTGGRAVVHYHEVTYSVVAPIPHPRFPPSIRWTYDVIARALEAALTSLGLPVTRRDRDPERQRHGGGSPLCFDVTLRHELTLHGQKVVGSAQRRWPAAFLQHGSILMRVPPAHTGSWFRGSMGSADSLTGICAHREGLTVADIHRALVTGWEHVMGVDLRPDELSREEAAVVAESSYARDLAVTQVV